MPADDAKISFKDRDPELAKNLLDRLRRIEGQARGVQRMIEEGRPCEDILHQLTAMRVALKQVGMKAIACHLRLSITDELRQGASGGKAIDEAMDLFLDFT